MQLEWTLQPVLNTTWSCAAERISVLPVSNYKWIQMTRKSANNIKYKQDSDDSLLLKVAASERNIVKWPILNSYAVFFLF
jgi:hypothetical protein